MTIDNVCIFCAGPEILKLTRNGDDEEVERDDWVAFECKWSSEYQDKEYPDKTSIIFYWRDLRYSRFVEMCTVKLEDEHEQRAQCSERNNYPKFTDYTAEKEINKKTIKIGKILYEGQLKCGFFMGGALQRSSQIRTIKVLGNDTP